MNVWLGRISFPLLAMIAYLATTWVITRSTRPPGDRRVDVRLEHLEKHGDDYDTIFLGASQTYLQISPHIFDGRLGQHGVDFHSFNMAIADSDLLYAYYVLERILRARPKRLRWIFLDSSYIARRSAEKNRRLSRQEVSWHTRELSMAAVEGVWASRRSSEWKIAETIHHGRSYLMRSGGIGRLARFVIWRRGVDPTMGPHQDGHHALPMAKIEPSRKRFMERGPDAFRQRIETIARGDPDPEQWYQDFYTAPELEWFVKLVALAEANGIHVVGIVPPLPHNQGWQMHTHFEEGRLETLLAYDDPDQFPELYRYELYWDAAHFNEEGTKLFSTQLADDFVGVISPADGS